MSSNGHVAYTASEAANDGLAHLAGVLAKLIELDDAAKEWLKHIEGQFTATVSNREAATKDFDSSMAEVRDELARACIEIRAARELMVGVFRALPDPAASLKVGEHEEVAST